MIVGLGLDVAGIERVARAIERYGERFLARLLTAEEVANAKQRVADQATFVAGRLAAKEATSKALGVPPGIGWHDVAVCKDPTGAPSLIFTGEAQRRAKALQVSRTHLSISHDAGIASAVVILERD